MPKAPKKKAPRKPRPLVLYGGFNSAWSEAGDSDPLRAYFDLQGGHTPGECRRIAAWLLRFAEWSEWMRERDDAKR